MNENKKNLLTILGMILTTALGTVNLVIEGVFEFILPLWGCTILSIFMIYFAYTTAKWHNKRHAFWHERDQAGGEPSALSIFLNKLSGWFLFALGMFLALLPILY